MSIEHLASFTYTGRATGEFYFDNSGTNPSVAVEVSLANEGNDLTGQPIAGQTVWWFGTFADLKPESKSKVSATDVTMKTLRAFGWKTDDVSKLEGLTDNDVELVIGPDTYEGKTKNKVKFVNKPGEGGRPRPKAELAGGALTAFASSLQNAARASRMAMGGGASAASAPAFRAGPRPAAPANGGASLWDGTGIDPAENFPR